MKKIPIILIILFLCNNISYGNDYEKEEMAYELHMEALGEGDYSKALIKYKTLKNEYSDTEYYLENIDAINGEIKLLDEDLRIEAQKEKWDEERKAKEEQERELKEAEWELKKSKRELKKAIKEREDRIKKLIREGRICIGMTRAQVIESWGRPNKVNESYYGTTLHEQWVYRYEKYATQYVYFEDGIVSSLSSSY